MNRRIRQLRRQRDNLTTSIIGIAAYLLGGAVAAWIFVGIVLIYCRMAGPLM